jgi:hypothetical protein
VATLPLRDWCILQVYKSIIAEFKLNVEKWSELPRLTVFYWFIQIQGPRTSNTWIFLGVYFKPRVARPRPALPTQMSFSPLYQAGRCLMWISLISAWWARDFRDQWSVRFIGKNRNYRFQSHSSHHSIELQDPEILMKHTFEFQKTCIFCRYGRFGFINFNCESHH